MPANADVLTALADVEEPELGRSVVDLGMVAGVATDGGLVAISLALPLVGDERAERLRALISAAVLGATDAGRVEFDVRAMTPEEQKACARVLRREPAPNPLKIIDANAPARPPERPNPFLDSATRVIAVSSGKGGVGKSSVTTNLAIALAARGHRVAAVDADVWGFSMPRMLGIQHPPDLVDDLIVPPSANGVRLISMGFFASEEQAVIWRGPMLHKALEQFLTDVHWGETDFLVVDMPPGTGDVALSMAQFVPRAEVIVVTTPQTAAQRVAQRAAAMAAKVDLEVIGVIENMSWFTGDDGKRYELFGAGGGRELADRLGVPLLGQVPLVPELRIGGDAGLPIVVAHPEDEASVAFREIAAAVEAGAERPAR
ncbi:MAG: Mrp/NBP35 family ATP-binding protein [Actinomycetes bacterium]